MKRLLLWLRLISLLINIATGLTSLEGHIPNFQYPLFQPPMQEFLHHSFSQLRDRLIIEVVYLEDAQAP